MIRPGVRRLFRLLLRRRDIVAQALEEEIRLHLERRTEQLVREGLSPEAARAEAVRRFGSVEDVRRAAAARERRRSVREGLDAIVRDARFAVRTLRRNPGFAAAAILTLALGIGANTVIFSAVNGILLRPLPFADPGRLVSVWPDRTHSKGELLTLRERARVLRDVAAYSENDEYTLTGAGAPVRLVGSQVSANLFDVLGVRAAVGRTLLPGESRPGSDGVVVLSHGLWVERFGADPAVVGRAVVLDGRSRTVVGVMPAEFRFPVPGTDVWVPLTVDAADAIDFWGIVFLRLVGRLRPGATPDQAAAEVRSAVPSMRERMPWPMPDDYGADVSAVSLRERLVGDVRPALLVLLGAVGFVLLIACANVASLLLARASGRQAEMSVRVALGAGRGRLVRQLLTESLILAMAGGTTGILLAAWGVSALATRLPAGIPRAAEVGMHADVLGFALATTLLTSLLFGFLPALRTARPARGTPLRGGAHGSGRASVHRRLIGALVAIEIAAAVVLATGAGLLIRSIRQLQRVNPGFRAEGVLTAQVAPPGFRYDSETKQRTFYADLLERVNALPDVSSVAAANNIPFDEGNTYFPVVIEGQPLPRGAAAPISVRWVVTPDYFATMGIPLRQGRAFTAADRPDAPPVVVVSETFAHRFWPGGDAIGKRIRAASADAWWTIVGVVGDVHRDDLTSDVGLAVYRPYAQHPVRDMTLVIRTDAAPRALAANLRSLVAAVDEDTPVGRIRMMRQVVSASMARPRFTTLLLTAFAALALILGAVGVYGVMSYAVHQETRDIGIRMALGARAPDVLRYVLRRGAVLAAAGIAVGLAGAFAAARLLRGFLFGVGPADPATFAAVPIVLAVVALLASYLPARRATRVDPAVVLRGE
ncbi:MAG TPA: ABC transporter permease [Longimicrobiales bacterium]